MRLKQACSRAGSALTTFNKGNMDLDPKVIAHRSPSTRGEMLVNPAAYTEFRHKAALNDQVRASSSRPVHVTTTMSSLAAPGTVKEQLGSCATALGSGHG